MGTWFLLENFSNEATSIKFEKLFISYSHADFKTNALSLYDYLKLIFPDLDVHIDQNLFAGDLLNEKNRKNLKDSDVVVLILTHASIISLPIIDEIAMAIIKEKRIICCLDDTLRMSWGQIPLSLSRYVGINFGLLEDLKRILVGEIKDIVGSRKKNIVANEFEDKLRKRLEQLKEKEEEEDIVK